MDNEWTTDATAPQERDGSSNINNVLTPEDIRKLESTSTSPVATIMSGVTSQSTPAGLAGSGPIETASGNEPDSDPPGFPGAFPETPADETTGFSVNPIPQTSGAGNPINLAPGEKVPGPSTLTSNATSSTARDDTALERIANDLEKTFGISPLPATSGTGNPVQLAAGEKVPPSKSFTDNTINSFVTTDEESYNKVAGPPQLPDVVTPQSERNNRENGWFNLPPISGSMIPESSLPLSGTSNEGRDPGVTIQSAGANSTTAALAGQVPLEPRGRPEMIPRGQQDEVSSNQEATNQTSGPDSSAVRGSSDRQPDETIAKGRNPDANIQSVGPSSTTAKLAGEVPLEPGSVPGGLPEVYQGDNVPEGGNVGPSSTTSKPAGEVPLQPGSVPGGLPEVYQGENTPEGGNVRPSSTASKPAGEVPLHPGSVPGGLPEVYQGEDLPEGGRTDDVTIQSIGENASTNRLAGDVPLEPRNPPRGRPENHQGNEDSGERKVDDFTIQSSGANTTTAALAGNVPRERPRVPEVVQESQQTAGFPPEASANPEALREKAALEEELESKVSKEPVTSEGVGGDAAGQRSLGEKTTSLLSHVLPASVVQSIDDINKGSTQGSMVPGFVKDTLGGGNKGITPSSMVPGFVKDTLGGGDKSTNQGSILPDFVKDTLGGGSKGTQDSASEDNQGIERSASKDNQAIQGSASKDNQAIQGSASGGNHGIAIAPTVPDVVQESITESHQSPEAAASTNAVEEKKAVESELLDHVKPVEATGEPAPSASVALSGETNQYTQGSTSEGSHGIAIAPTVPDVVQESIAESHQSPEAAASTDVVEEKKAVESELLEHVKPVEAMGEPAPSASVALSGKAPVPTSTAQATDDITDVGTNDIAAPDPTSKAPVKRAMAEAIQTRHDSGDISPLSYPVRGIPEGPDVVYHLGTEISSPAVDATVSQTVPQTVPHVVDPPVSETVTEGLPQTVQPTAPQAVSESVPQAVHPKNTQTGSSVNTSVPTSSTPQKSRAEAIPASSTKSTQAASEASASSDKKSKRASGFFGKLKQKFSHKE